MNLQDVSAIYNAIPLGAENAERPAQIHKRIGMWAHPTVRKHLARMVVNGRVRKRAVYDPRNVTAFVYWREAA